MWQPECSEGSGCRYYNCGMQNISIDYVEANKFDVDVPIFDITKNNSLIFSYDRTYRNRMYMDTKQVRKP